jgi:hypothetical protein
MFVARTWTSPPLIYRASEYIGVDMIPTDICPLTWESKEYVVFNSDNGVRDQTIVEELPRTDYEYTISTTFYVDGATQCSTESRTTARDSCNMFVIDEVTMFYFSKPNYGRFHFHTREGTEV